MRSRRRFNSFGPIAARRSCISNTLALFERLNPMYGGPLHNVGFVERILAQLHDVDRETYPTFDRIEGMLHTAMEEVTFGATQSNANGATPAGVV
jgi:tRNA G26 N,N-dimethylase Trm1